MTRSNEAITCTSSFTHDPNLDGFDLFCISVENNKPEKYPLGKGENVGLQLSYVVMDSEGVPIEDKSCYPLRGCIYFSGGKCSKINGETGLEQSPYCPVSGVVSIADFREKQNQIKKLLVVK